MLFLAANLHLNSRTFQLNPEFKLKLEPKLKLKSESIKFLPTRELCCCLLPLLCIRWLACQSDRPE